jgi:hypothetical protein
VRAFLLRAWIRFVDKLGEWLFGILLTSGVLVVLLKGGANWIALEWSCVRQSSCAVSGPSLGAAIVVLLVFAGQLGWLIPFYWRHRKRKFKPFDVVDEQLKLKWSMRADPDGWLHKGFSESTSPTAIDAILVGPVHDIPTCNDNLATRGANTFGNREYERRCPGCRDALFSKDDPHTPLVNALRWGVFHELERLDRLTPLKKRMKRRRIVLERPQYWRVIHPPASPNESGPEDSGPGKGTVFHVQIPT